MRYSDTLANTILYRYPDPDKFPYRSWCYSQGFLLWGFLKLYEFNGDSRYRDYVLQYCDAHVMSDGSISGFSGDSLDDIMPGSVLVWAYVLTREERYRLACDKIRRIFDDYPRNINGAFWYHRYSIGEMRVDGLFMGLMFLARYGKYIGDTAYCYEETVKQLQIIFACCEKDDSGLLYHAYCEKSRAGWSHPITGKSSEVWSEGLGWYALILSEVLELLPRIQKGYAELTTQLQKLLNALVKVQDPASGLWHQVVDKTGFPRNWHDTSGSAMFVYALQKTCNLKLFEESSVYTASAQKGFAGICTKALPDPNGLLNIYDACDGLGVQYHYDNYVDFVRNVNAKEAVAAFLWAATIMEYQE